jgi:hypothetical protein
LRRGEKERREEGKEMNDVCFQKGMFIVGFVFLVVLRCSRDMRVSVMEND